MNSGQILVGDVCAILPQMADESVDCVVTSPPYFGLRDYGVEGQLGGGRSVQAFVEELVDVFAEVWRIMKPRGTLWLNLGDTYNSGKPGNDGPRSLSASTIGAKDRTSRRAVAAGAVPQWKTGEGWKRCDDVPRKDLIGVPWRVALALQEFGWRLRSEIIWHKPNPTPESCRDRPTRAHETIFLFAKRLKYHFDQAAVATKAKAPWKVRTPMSWDTSPGSHNTPGRFEQVDSGEVSTDSANIRDVWTVPTQRFNGAHFATFPLDVVRPCVRAGCPKGGIVLDPFLGSGTVGVVADEEGLDWIGVELNPAYADIARERTRVVQGRLP